ncbi:hypothetical protein LCGC14_2750780 [marine sediment metagenome]|uniref:Uncharacterized protein n=1 Tax=marine sediment metagenome TaxID=412755 RepID=A0A0F8ZNW0_9ZZZZ
MNEPICPHCGGGPADEQHQRECEEDTVLFQQQARIADLERQLAEAAEREVGYRAALKKITRIKLGWSASNSMRETARAALAPAQGKDR